MIRWTTPTLTCSMPDGITCDYVILTIRQGDLLIEKTIQSSEITEDVFSVTLTQSETGSLIAHLPCEAQLNIVKDDVRLATNVVELEIDINLHNEAIV